MVRTQIYLTERQRDELAVMARSEGKKQSELIRMAIDRLLKDSSDQTRTDTLRSVAGIWKDRTDLPDFAALRASWDRS